MIRTIAVVSLLSFSYSFANPSDGQKPDHPTKAEPAKTDPAKAEPTKPTPPESKPAAPPSDHGGSQLRLAGVALVVPAGWESQQIQPGGAMAPKAVYKIPALKAGDEPGMIRITHFPEMKGKDDQNIDRWIAQVTKADGTPAARGDAKVEKTESGNIRLTTVDVSGNVKMTMRDTGKPDHRMIAAILDHPKGPHFIVAAGPVESMKSWEADIMKFLKSATVIN